MFEKVLIANRGEIALRVARTCQEMGIRTVVAHSEADRDSAAVRFADESKCIGPAPVKGSYLNAAAVLTAALQTGAEAIHPGYGFLSEDADFADACARYGISLIGPDSELMAELGDKSSARVLMSKAGLALLPGSLEPLTVGRARVLADEIGYPVIIKAVAGGGGRGMSVVDSAADFTDAFVRTRAIGQTLFGDDRVYVERYLPTARHVEVQILADTHGRVIHLGERDCSVQRHRQKLVEETPAPRLPPGLADRMCRAATAAAASVGYTGAGTVEFLVDERGEFYFMEVNCRLQVEHAVTEAVTGIDLVREQISVASGHALSLDQPDVDRRGVAIECRVNAEDPTLDFRPTASPITEFLPPGGPFVRVDSHAFAGYSVPPNYDSLLAKLVVWAPERDQAIARALRALREFRLGGPTLRTTADFLRRVLEHPKFAKAEHNTSLVRDIVSTEA
ncbi:acetyl-CoA carboxylase biotin carboxylase subunit [Saccharothrix ecbatanensis]|uniref:biotin carboxylase n=1 Tax=Saccharothrix ecbatanensis TaxID=1105145 RepID=A0A7W9LZV6_9PSEU|nr:acetyl-CoA carboxylase biotin carboxylase subunit [Saccharothrix ecbatanensis]MBB5802226.1 acetyl-CoA carboxylase biotin carboxylase subunit [Saccharothrix ecbatanensis]